MNQADATPAKPTKLVAQLTAAAGAGVPAGEPVLAAVRVNLKSTVAATAAGALGGVAGAAVAARVAGDARSATDAGFSTAAQQALGLTDRHLVVCSRSSLTGRPKAFHAAIPLTAIAGVTHEPGRLGDSLTFAMQSGAVMTFQCVKVDPGAAFAAALAARLAD